MDVTLIDRSKRPIALTAPGQVFVNEAKTILDRMNSAMSKVHDASTGLVGTLRIGYTKGYEKGILPNLLKEFHRDFPNILFTCYRADTDTLASGLLNNDFDIIFTWDSTNIIAESEIQYIKMESVPLYVALNETHPLAHRTSLHRRELKDEPILFMTPSATGESYGDDRFMELYHKAGYQPNIIFRSGDTASLLMMVSAEEGITIIPSYLTHTLPGADNLVFVPLIGESEFEEIIAVWKKGNTDPALQHLIGRL